VRKLALLLATLAAAVGASPAAAHIFIDGRCLEVGSNKEAPVVGQGAPRNDLGQLDLIYDPRSGVDVTAPARPARRTAAGDPMGV
jgi:hypothetical protein